MFSVNLNAARVCRKQTISFSPDDQGSVCSLTQHSSFVLCPSILMLFHSRLWAFVQSDASSVAATIAMSRAIGYVLPASMVLQVLLDR